MRLTLPTLTLCSEIWEAFISVKRWSPSGPSWAETELVIFTSLQSGSAQQIQEPGSGAKAIFMAWLFICFLYLVLFLAK